MVRRNKGVLNDVITCVMVLLCPSGRRRRGNCLAGLLCRGSGVQDPVGRDEASNEHGARERVVVLRDKGAGDQVPPTLRAPPLLWCIAESGRLRCQVAASVATNPFRKWGGYMTLLLAVNSMAEQGERDTRPAEPVAWL